MGEGELASRWEFLALRMGTNDTLCQKEAHGRPRRGRLALPRLAVRRRAPAESYNICPLVKLAIGIKSAAELRLSPALSKGRRRWLNS